MAKSKVKPAKKPYIKAVLFGIVSIALYTAVFINERYVRELWAHGGVYAALPILTVFVFSYVHGNFASYVFSVLGLEAKKSK